MPRPPVKVDCEQAPEKERGELKVTVKIDIVLSTKKKKEKVFRRDSYVPSHPERGKKERGYGGRKPIIPILRGC